MPAIALRVPEFTTVADLRANYAAATAALRDRSRAVPDLGINLRRKPASPHICISDDQYAAFLAELNRPLQTLYTHVVADRICNIVARKFKIIPGNIRRKTRIAEYLLPRHIAMFVCVTEFRYSLVKTGRVLGGRDHSTVLHACRKIRARMEADPAFAQEVRNLMAACRGEG